MVALCWKEPGFASKCITSSLVKITSLLSVTAVDETRMSAAEMCESKANRNRTYNEIIAAVAATAVAVQRLIRLNVAYDVRLHVFRSASQSA